MAAPPARLELALGPTPILKLDRLSRRLGAGLHVKRDALTGLLTSGDKVPHLQVLVANARQQRADTLLARGAPQSTACRAAAALAARLGLRAVLLVRGEPPVAYDGNLLLGRLLGAEVRYCAEADFARAGEIMETMATEIRARRGGALPSPLGGLK